MMTFEELLTYQYLHDKEFCIIQTHIINLRERMNACTDTEIVQLWELFGDVPVGIFDENGELLEDADGIDEDPINENFFVWSQGTPRDEIWHWFDQNYSGGLHKLIYAE